MTTKQQHAADHIGAADMNDGTVRYYDEATSAHYIAPIEDLDRLAELMESEDEDERRDAYSLWCGEFSHEEAEEEEEEEEEEYSVMVHYRESGNWMDTAEPEEDFTDLDEAKAYADSCEDGDYGEGEFRAEVTDADGDVVYTHEWKVDPDQDALDAATWLVKEVGEYSTTSYGVGEDGKYIRTTQNGGSRGAHSRQEGDGRWDGMADEVEEIELAELFRAVIADKNTAQEAADMIADAGAKGGDADDLLKEIIGDITMTLDVQENETEDGGGWANGRVMVGRSALSVGGGWILGAKAARDANNSAGLQPEEHPEMQWPGASYAGDFQPYQGNEMGDLDGLAKALGVDDSVEDLLMELVNEASCKAWADRDRAEA